MPFPKLATLTDRFNGAGPAPDPQWATGEFTQGGGVVSFTWPALGVPQATLRGWGPLAADRYELLDSHALVEVAQLPTIWSSVNLTLFLTDATSTLYTEVLSLFRNGLTGAVTLFADTTNWTTSTTTNHASAPYDPVAHRWLRIREAAGTTYFETSPNGCAWSVFASTATHSGADRVWPDLDGRVVDGATASGTLAFDNFNVADCARVRVFAQVVG